MFGDFGQPEGCDGYYLRFLYRGESGCTRHSFETNEYIIEILLPGSSGVVEVL